MERYMMNIKSVLLTCTVLASFNGITAEKLTVYRWVDENNVVHFSQHQPAHDNYTEIDMVNNKNASAPVEIAKPDQVAPSEKPDIANVSPNNPDNDKCNAAKQNVATLEDFDKIQYKDENGNLKVLSAKEKQQQLAINTTQVEVYCTKK